MLLGLLFSSPLMFVLLAGALLISITIHEFAHAWVADRLGDPTPRYQGRVSLDPRAHLDPLGTISLLLVGFGWGKPVPFDPYNLRDPERDGALIALAGPASNLIFALIISIVFGLANAGGTPADISLLLIQTVVFINVMLAIFNLVPVYPLDGSKIALALLPKNLALEYEAFMQRYGALLLIALIVPWSGSQSPISRLIMPAIESIVSLYMQLW
jgi:Zn-dependent protease